MPFFGQNLEIGCDIGSHSIKWVEGIRRGTQFKLTNYLEKPLSYNAIVDGKIRDFAAIARAFKDIFSKASSRENVSIAIQGAEVIVKKIKLPTLSSEESGACIEWEALQYFPFEKENAFLDYARIGDSQAVILGASKNLVNSYTQFLNDLKITIKTVETPCLALEKVWKVNYPEDAQKNVAILSLGASFSSLTLFHNNTLHWHYPVFFSGNNLTTDIQKNLKLTFEEAENLKQGGREGAPTEINKMIDNNLEQLGEKVLHTFKIFLAREPSMVIEKIYVTGGVSKMPHLVENLSSKLGIQVNILEPFKNILLHKKKMSKDTLNQVETQAAAALGLALKE